MGHHDSETTLAEDDIGQFHVWTYAWWTQIWVKMTEEQYGYAGEKPGVSQQHVDRTYDNVEEAMKMHLLCVRNVVHRIYPGNHPQFEAVDRGSTTEICKKS